MSGPRSITINGDLGSGKSTVAVLLAERLGLRRVSMGDIYRQMADERGMTALQLNKHSEHDTEIDTHVDRIQRDMAASGEAMVVDSRLGWHFFADAYKVHLITDPTVAARRVLGRPADGVESYTSLEEARRYLRERSDSERDRFIVRYQVDKTRLRNYSLICDTTRVGPQEAATHVIDAYRHDSAASPVLLLDPARLYPTERIDDLPRYWDGDGRDLIEELKTAGMGALEPVNVGYDGERFFVIDGHRRVSAALRAGLPLVRAGLVAEAGENVVGDLSAGRYFESAVRLDTLHAWEAVHGIEIPLPPHLLQDAQT